MQDFSRVHPKWREVCLNCRIPICAEDLPAADPRKLRCPVYRQQCRLLQAAAAKTSREAQK